MTTSKNEYNAVSIYLIIECSIEKVKAMNSYRIYTRRTGKGTVERTAA